MLMIEDKDSPGIQAIYEACYTLYSDQPTPPQVTALQKFWLGGPDPLDFISMYENNGFKNNANNDFESSCAHWHYITYGLSDLYGDARLHDQSSSDGPSGFGFELTFRLKRSNEIKAPLWPAMLLQSLARYLFRSQAKFAPGDHIPWGRPLEDTTNCSKEDEEFSKCNSRITNMLIAPDAQIQRVYSKHGYIDFFQVVGICDEEMQLARRWSGIEMIAAMRKRVETGGSLLVTDMRRGESLNDLEGNFHKNEGSNLSGVTTEVSWGRWGSLEEIIDVVGEEEYVPIKNVQQFPQTPFYGINISPGTLELLHPHFLENIHLKISKDAGEIMFSAITDRLKFQRHFTFLHCRSDMAVTLVTENITGTFVSEDKPYGFRGAWLQILVNKELIMEMERDFANLKKIETNTLPLYFRYSKFKLLISVHLSDSLDLDKYPLDNEDIIP
uniref:Sufu-like protein n=1 Tax=Schmidtea mediterranea TaxID=79327 RepID=D2ILS2_SCHMD|nr:sufu-like protein [Schmidtea mediterranea]